MNDFGTSRGRRGSSRRTLWLAILGGGSLLLVASALLAAAPAPGAAVRADVAQASEPATPLESPLADCFEWKYPDKEECGALRGKTECKAEPSLNSVIQDEEKRKACQPTEGDECFCGDDDFGDDDDDDDDDDF